MNMSNLQTNLYNILGVEQNVSIDELKQCYHKLVLKYHPDRNVNTDNNKSTTQNNKLDKNNELFLKIQEAWEILRDENKRKLYDKRLNQQKYKQNSISISYKATLNECDFIDNETDENGNTTNIYEYPCRCGDYFEIQIDASSMQKSKSNSNSIITSCVTCCLKLNVTF
eukprot:88379_1